MACNQAVFLRLKHHAVTGVDNQMTALQKEDNDLPVTNNSRRTFLKCSVTGSGLALIAIHNLALAARTNSDSQATSVSSEKAPLELPLVTLHFNNDITLFNSRAEMGQGVTTTLAQYLLDEMDVDWQQVTEVRQALANEEIYGPQATIGALSSLIGWKVHRDAGAKIRQLLLNQAAAIWQVETNSLNTQSGYVVHSATDQRISYGELASFIKDPKLPEEFTLKEIKHFNYIGKSQPRLDLPDKVCGKAKFGIDVQMPGLKTAVIVRPPVFGAQLKSANIAELKTQKGVVDVIVIPQGLAIVAEGYWQAQRVRKLANIKWQEADFSSTSSASLMESFKSQLQKPEKTFQDKGDVIAAMEQAKSDKHNAIINYNFEFPLVAHATMEPMNCAAWQDGDILKIWAPTQNSGDAKRRLMHDFSLEASQLEIHTTLMGGGFGRRAQDDFVMEAAELARKVAYPVKVVWSREDDIQHDYYRPLNAQAINVLLDEKQHIDAWQHNVATLSTAAYHFSFQERNTDAGDWVGYGGAEHSLYKSEHFSCGVTQTKTPMTTGILRGISHGYTNFSREVVISEVAKSLEADPIAFRRKHIENERALAVLDEFARVCEPYADKDKYRIGHAFGYEKAPSGPYQYYNTACMVFAQKGQTWRPEKLLLVLDHGLVVNPDGLLSQLQGATVFALGMMLHNRIDLVDGQIQQSNFHDYIVPRFGTQIPVELHTIKTEAWPMGVGEKLQGTIQPAIANAIANITGTPVTQLPIDPATLNQHHIQLGGIRA